MSFFEQTKVTNSSGTIINPAQDEGVILLRKIVKLLESSATIDAKQRQKVVMEAVGNSNGTPTEAAGTIPVSGAMTLSGSSNAVNSTAVASSVNVGNVTIQYGPQASTAGTGIDSRFSMIDTARNAYANGIRPNMIWK
ncbi:MAG TPA: hypothetical protein VMR41_02020 [Patescibacteria group bacterium]|nr:hypothetical protein [Patescibacteria group bacterium]